MVVIVPICIFEWGESGCNIVIQNISQGINLEKKTKTILGATRRFIISNALPSSNCHKLTITIPNRCNFA